MATVQGRYDDASALAAETYDLMASHGHKFHSRLVFQFQTAAIRWLRGDLDADEAIWWERVSAAEPKRPMWRGMTMWLAAETGRMDRAVADLDAIDLDRFTAAEPRLDWFPILSLTAMAITRIGDRERAQLVYDALLPYSSRNATTGQAVFWGAVNHHLGRLASVLERHEDAADHLGDALVRHRRMGAVAMTGHTQRAIDALP